MLSTRLREMGNDVQRGRVVSVCYKRQYLADEVTVDDVSKSADGCHCSILVRSSKFVEKQSITFRNSLELQICCLFCYLMVKFDINHRP